MFTFFFSRNNLFIIFLFLGWNIDSKTLTAEKRDNLLEVMIEHEEKVKWAVTVMSPYDLSRGMLRRNPYNL